MRVRLLVTGANGQLGSELRRLLTEGRGEIGPTPACYEGAEVRYASRRDLDIASDDAVRAYFDQHGPFDVVFNCAADTNVDRCEADSYGAYAANAYGPELLARACTASGAKLVHVSTDYVFAGDVERDRVEDDAVSPLGVYGASKLAGERLVAHYCPRSFIVRTAWLYGYRGRNFVKTMLRLARENGSIRVVADQFGNPTSANDVAYEMLKLATTEEYGVYHCTNEGTCSWYDFACAVVDGAGVACTKTPLTTEEFPRPARRPAYSSLANARLAATVGNEMRPWREALASYLDRLEELGD